MFKGGNVRRLGDGSEPPTRIRDMTGSALVLIKADGVVDFETSKSGKDALIKRYTDNDILLFLWHGHWRTDPFLVTGADLDKYY
jgi:hypothetical protein